jgi:ABC-type Mn2+/Zn2+ transport system permease subunit
VKVLFAVVLVLNFLTEALAAAALIGGPEGIGAAGKGGMWSMHYGFAALAIASVSVLAWRKRQESAVINLVIGVLLVFHTGLAISLFVAGDQQAGQILHTLLAALLLVLCTQRANLTT